MCTNFCIVILCIVSLIISIISLITFRYYSKNVDKVTNKNLPFIYIALPSIVPIFNLIITPLLFLAFIIVLVMVKFKLIKKG